MILRIVLTILVVLVAGIYLGYRYLDNNLQRQMASMTISDVDLSRIADGTYSGSHTVFPVSVEVKVTVKDHRIHAIELVEHNNGRGAGAEAIPARVIEAQRLTVDAVSGATISSKVMLKAIEKALSSAL